MNKNNKEPTYQKKWFFLDNVYLFLLIIGAIALIVRLMFLHTEIPFNSDNFIYFKNAVDMTLGETEVFYRESNSGWPGFLSIIFSTFQSTNFMDYMALQRYVSIILSVITIIPVYLLGKQFFAKQYALLGAAIFVLEPRIIQNSLFGITEPLYILTIVLALVFLLKNTNKFAFLSFALIGLATIIRFEGIILLPAFSIVYFLYQKDKKKKIPLYLCLILIFVIILLPTSVLRMQENYDDGFAGKIIGNIQHEAYSERGEYAGITSLVVSGTGNLFKFLALSMVSYLVFFVPLGIILLIKNNQKQDKALLIIGFSLLIPAVYSYALASDSRYLFTLYPLFSIAALYTIKKIFERFRREKILSVIIISSFIVISVYYLNLKDIDVEHELEVYNTTRLIGDKIEGISPNTILYTSPGTEYLHLVKLTQSKEFPVSTSEYFPSGPLKIGINIDTMNGYMEQARNGGITHLVLDYRDTNPKLFDDVFYEREKYSFLVKEFDSNDYGYDYIIKIYRIDFKEFDRVKIEN